MTQAVGTRVQALLNWHNHGVGAVDGWWGKYPKSDASFSQKAKGLYCDRQSRSEDFGKLYKVVIWPINRY